MGKAACAFGTAGRTAMVLAIASAGCAQVLSIDDWTDKPNATGAGGHGATSASSGGSQSASVGSGGMAGSASSSSGTGGQGGGGQDLCGNGQLDSTEECDDGDAAPGDGCDAKCALEPGYECNGEPSVCCAPEPEVCDGLDNDCNGAADEGCSCMDGAEQNCYTGPAGTKDVGECKSGLQTCANGQWEACIGEVLPAPEACDSLDNNCNVVVDEGNPGGGAICMTNLPGMCAEGTAQCLGGSLMCVSNMFPVMETCNGIDDNCNGQIDEGNPGGGQTCMVTGQHGLCAVGQSACVAGSVICMQTVQPSTEVCDAKDNDCDGLIDDGVNYVVVFSEAFINNVGGWTLDPEWAIGATSAGPMPPLGNPDPATDHSATVDNGVAGVVLGGNYGTSSHSYTYLTSPTINATASGGLVLDFWRWLNSDAPPQVTNRIEVFNGTSWIVVWQQSSGTITDSAWKNVNFDLTPFKNAAMRVRFGFAVGSAGVISSSGWNIDDFMIRRCP